jgi:uncharacterized membrane protein YccC
MTAETKNGPKKPAKKASKRTTKSPTMRAARKIAPAAPEIVDQASAVKQACQDGDDLVERVSRSIERELLRIDTILERLGDDGQQAEAERRARTLASLARTLKEVTNLRNEQEKQKPVDDDDIPRDIEQLRRELARRLEGLVAEAKTVCPDEAETERD